jgi:hypothetical protein
VNTPPRRMARWAPLAIAATAALCASAPAASALDTTIRIEGSAETLVPESAITIEADGTDATLYDVDFAAWPVSRGSAFWQVYRAASGAGLDFGFKGYSFGLQVLTIGPDGSAGSVGWQYKVNHVAAQVGADSTMLADGDEVLWFHGGFAGARDLDVAPSADRLPRGTSFTVTVVSYDETGAPSPAAGAAVTYGTAQATADGQGRATFIAQGAGVAGVRATRAGDVRSATRNVCSYDADPTVCNLPPAPPGEPAPASPPAGAGADTVAPGSAVRVPALGSTRSAVRRLAGTAGPDRSDVARVEVSAGLRVGTLCRFRTAAGGLTGVRDCGRPEWLTARVAGGNWMLPLGRRGLTPGVWRIETRATDGAGNTETVRLPGTNIGAVRVRGRVIAPVTRITSPRPGGRVPRLSSLRGVAGPAAADIALVEVALARRTARGCRFVTASGRLARARSCSRPVYLPARSHGARWILPLATPPAPGVWRALARARGAEGTVGRPAVVTFRVTGGRR